MNIFLFIKFILLFNTHKNKIFMNQYNFHYTIFLKKTNSNVTVLNTTFSYNVLLFFNNLNYFNFNPKYNITLMFCIFITLKISISNF